MISMRSGLTRLIGVANAAAERHAPWPSLAQFPATLGRSFTAGKFPTTQNPPGNPPLAAAADKHKPTSPPPKDKPKSPPKERPKSPPKDSPLDKAKSKTKDSADKTKDKAKKFEDKTKDSGKKSKDKTQDVVEKAKDKTKKAGQTIKDSAKGIKDGVKEALKPPKDSGVKKPEDKKKTKK